ncbi:MAG: hypothetical protein MAG453_01032 [Calditrichaeota bacterium]|nr:hypothetical protein [Calditrichota bacterium]
MLAPLLNALSALDGLLAGAFSLPVRIILWGVVSGAATIALYRLVSKQGRIRELKRRLRELRKRMMDPDIERAEYMRLTKQNLRLALRQLYLTLLPTLVGGLPILLVIVWLSVYHGFIPPAPGERVAIMVEPDGVPLEVIPADHYYNDGDRRFLVRPERARELEIRAGGETIYAGNPFAAPLDVLHKRQGWNWLLPNPNGYIDEAAPVQRIRFDLTRTRLFDSSPEWLGAWELWFVVAVFVTTLTLKLVFRIE